MQQAMAIARRRAGFAAAALLPPLRACAGAFQAWAAAERGRFALWLPLAMAFGILTDLTLRAEPVWWLGGSVLATGLAVGLAAPLVPRPLRLLRGAGWLAAAAGLGVASAQFATWQAVPIVQLPRRAAIVTGQVHLVEKLPEGARLTLDAPSLNGAPPLARRLRIRMHKDDPAEVAPGDTVQVRALVGAPAGPAYPGAWDLQRDAFFNGLGGYGFAIGPTRVLATTTPVAGPALWLQELRAGIAARVTAVLPGPDGAIAATLLTGFTSAIPDADKTAFRDSGLAHLLAIAGLHIGIVMGWVLAVTRLGLAAWEYAALRWPTKQIAMLAALAAGGFYMLLTGSHVPIVRSFAMASLVVLAILVGRRAVSLRGLALAAVVIMLVAPNEVLGVSFQMSFSAVLALISGYELLRPVLQRLRAAGSARGGGARSFAMHIVGLALTSALAGTFSAPFAAYHFGRVQIYFVLANMVAVPLTAFWVMPLGMIALLLMPFHLEAAALVPMAWGIEAIVWIARTVSAMPSAVFAVPPAPAWGMVVLTLGVAWLGIWRTRVRWAGLVAMAVGVISPLSVTPPDILVSGDARLIGVRTEHGAFAIAKSGASHFTRDSWLQLWAEHDFQRLPKTGDAAAGAISCVPDACVVRHDATGPVATVLRGPAAGEDCDADVLVSSEPIRLRCGVWVPWVDRFSVWRDGSHAIWLAPDGPVIVSDRDHRGDRPWVPPLPVPRARQ